MNAFALETIPHSRSTLIAVVIAHVAAGLLAVQLFEARRYIEPAPLMVDLLQAPPEEKVDAAPQPLPQAPEPIPELKREPEPVKPEPVVREEPKPIERVMLPEPAPEIAPPPPKIVPPAPPPMPEPVVAAPEPTAITVPVPPPPVAEPAPVEPEVPEVTMTAQMLTAAYRSNPKPSYPGASRRLGEQGTVLLRVYVTSLGDPTRVELKSTSGHPRLDQSAQEAVHRWKFVPAKRGEQPVDAWVIVPIKFSLKG